MGNTARIQAYKDISVHILELQNDNNLSYGDCYYVTPNRMKESDKEITRLNRELGIHNINYFK